MSRLQEKTEGFLRQLEILYSAHSTGLNVALIVFFALLFFDKVILFGAVVFPSDWLYVAIAPWNYAHLFTHSCCEIGDPTVLYFPLASYAKSSVAMWQLPLWNPYIYGGAPLIGYDQAAFFFPLNALLYVLPLKVALSVIVIAKLIIAGLGMQIYTKELGASGFGQIVSAAAFMFSGFIIIFLMYPQSNIAILLPYLFLAAELLLRRVSSEHLALLAILVILLIFAGQLEIAFQALAALVLYGFIRAVTRFGFTIRMLRWIAVFAADIAFGLIGSAIHLMPSIEYILNSVRYSVVTGGRPAFLGPLPLSTGIFFLIPNLLGNGTWPHNFVGPINYTETHFGVIAIPILLMIPYSLYGHNRRQLLPLFVLCILSLGLAYGVPGIYDLIVLIPGFSIIPARRALLIFAFSASVLSGLGATAFSGKINSKMLRPFNSMAARVVTYTGFAILVVLAAYFIMSVLAKLTYSPDVLAFAEQNIIWFVFDSCAILFIACFLRPASRGRQRTLVLSILMVLILIDSAHFGGNFNPQSNPAIPLTEETPGLQYLQSHAGLYRVTGVGDWFVAHPNTLMPFQLLDANGYDGLEPRYQGLLAGLPTEKFWDLLSVRYLITVPSSPSQEANLTLVYDNNDMRIYENPNALPRVFLVHNAFVAANDTTAITTLASSDFNITSTAVVENVPFTVSPITGSLQGGWSNITSYSPEDVKVSTSSVQQSLLVLTDIYFPGWNAYLDGLRVPIYRADAGLRSVMIPAGSHEVEFKYEPASFAIGSALTSLVLGICVLFIVFRRRHPFSALRSS